MPSAAEIALAAYEALPKEVKEDPREKAEREHREAEDRRWEFAQATLDFSPLSKWFPGVEWSIMAFGKPGTSSQYHGEGREIYVSPPERNFTLWLDSTSKTIASASLQDPRMGIGVQYVRWNEPLPVDFEGYWRGIDVNGAADIGALLAADEAIDRKRVVDGKHKRRRVP